MAQIGRPKKYGSAGALKKAVDAYWESISYQVPAVISTPTGEVGEDGRIKYASKLLTEGRDGTGRPKTVIEFLEPPSTAALLLYLGVSRSTWSAYRSDEKLGPVVDYWDARYEAYLVDRLETGKHIQGVIFNLEHNFGYKHRVETGMDRETRKAITASGMTMEEKLAVLREAARDFGEARSTREQGPNDGAEQKSEGWRPTQATKSFSAQSEELGRVAESAERDKARDGGSLPQSAMPTAPSSEGADESGN